MFESWEWRKDTSYTIIDRARSVSANKEYPPPYIIENSDQRIGTVTPFLNNELFFEFSNLPDSSKEILKFVSQYGLLTGSLTLNKGNGELVFGDSLDFLIHEKWILRSAIELWEAISSKNWTRLNKYVVWRKVDGIFTGLSLYFGTEEDLNYILHNDFDPNTITTEVRQVLVVGQIPFTGKIVRFIDCSGFYKVPSNTSLGSDYFGPAMSILMGIVNIKMRQYSVIPAVEIASQNTFRQSFIPTSLLSGMWYQFFRALTGERRYKQCVICNGWVDVTQKRSDWTHHPKCGSTNRSRRRRKTLTET